jgi:hypothetical protein
LERKLWPKYGEVRDVPRGEHKKGDYFREKNIAIETSENSEKFEIDIVNKIKMLDTQDIKATMQKQQHQQKMDALNNKGGEQLKDKDERNRLRDEFFAASIA